ncbi:UDP-N-acetylenolpyruvoylglucosamine reductase [Gossypium arboreum]|uniref:UDP-N-acetylenolpyruvoylglucosamine reductase n=1 Tax=Gossypium arboreum TaxID=29729 RepID=A0A0B0PWL9_GOSAR|nr:chalcone isomerase-like protein 1 isoform X1 [Gossypium arboreum]KHG29425.1 UDP-N-acetylenolpyruvoylglucosamine reductase [Gossypium arboreum]
MYADNEKLKDLLKSKIGKAPEKPTKELYQMVIDSDVEIVVRLVIVYSSLTISMVRKNFGEGLGASIKKLNGGKKNDELANKVMGQASDDIKLTSGSLIEISRLPGFVLETKGECLKVKLGMIMQWNEVMGEVISKVESELLCRAYINMYLGDDPLDKDAKDKFGISLISLF